MMASWKRYRAPEPLQSTQHDEEGLAVLDIDLCQGQQAARYHCSSFGEMMGSNSSMRLFGLRARLHVLSMVEGALAIHLSHDSSIYADQTSTQICFDSHSSHGANQGGEAKKKKGGGGRERRGNC